MAKSNKKTTIPKRLKGIVFKISNENTIIVRVERKFPHPLYRKIISNHKKYQVQCEDKAIEVGDIVLIEEGRPVSKRKSFYLIEKIEKN